MKYEKVIQLLEEAHKGLLKDGNWRGLKEYIKYLQDELK